MASDEPDSITHQIHATPEGLTWVVTVDGEQVETHHLPPQYAPQVLQVLGQLVGSIRSLAERARETGRDGE